MRKKRNPQKKGDKFTHPVYGEFVVLNYDTTKRITIRFLKTGTVSTVQGKDIHSMLIRDYNHPSVCGVGYRGYGKHVALVDSKTVKAYSTWNSMIHRCYDQARLDKSPTYANCSVDERWHNYQNFADWFYDNYVDGYHLDKDIKVNGNRIYGPDTCLFVHVSENAKAATQKKHSFRSPKGDLISFVNLNEFCKANSLDRVCMSRVKSGARKSHKGWTKAEQLPSLSLLVHA